MAGVLRRRTLVGRIKLAAQPIAPSPTIYRHHRTSFDGHLEYVPEVSGRLHNSHVLPRHDPVRTWPTPLPPEIVPVGQQSFW